MTLVSTQDIGYVFLKTYYQRIRDDSSKLFHLYSPNSEITHIDYAALFQQGSLFRTTRANIAAHTKKIIGKDNINTFFTKNKERLANMKYKIESCDFQSITNSGIFMVVMGELAFNDSCGFRFTQSFVLSPSAKDSKMYDLTNDIMKFIVDEEEEIEEEIFTAEDATKTTAEGDGESVANDGESAGGETETVAEPEPVSSTVASAASAAAAPTKPLNWADRLAKDGAPAKAAPGARSEPKAKASSPQAPKEDLKKKNGAKPGDKSKEQSVLILCRGTQGVSLQDVQDALEAAFGKVKKVTVSSSQPSDSAWVEFASVESQTKAVDAKNIKVKGREIEMFHRTKVSSKKQTQKPSPAAKKVGVKVARKDGM